MLVKNENCLRSSKRFGVIDTLRPLAIYSCMCESAGVQAVSMEKIDEQMVFEVDHNEESMFTR